MAKRRRKKTSYYQTGIKQVVILLGLLFSAVLFLIRVITGGVGWFEIFAPVIVAFFIVFFLEVLRTGLRKL